MALKKRDVQTQVKHIILSEYLGTWAGIILNGKAGTARNQALRGRPFQTRLIYVDGFSYKGRYEGDTTDVMLNGTPSLPTWGSPILGIQALDKAQQFAQQRHGFHTDIATILVEDDDDDFPDLQESLRLAGFEQRVLLNPPIIAPPDGKISLTQGNFLTYAEPILGYIAQPYTNALVLLDPYGPKGLPYATVSRIVAHQDADVMINLPYQDLHKKLGYLLNEGERPGDRALLANYDAMFGTGEWRAIAARVKAEVPPEEQTERFEEELANFYLERLRAADPTLVVKNIRLQFPDKDRTMFYLYLTTHDPTGALALNKILYEAKLTEYELKWNRQQAKWVHESHQAGLLTLFD
ncbi:MAG: three-Cys-motif partner protein TcmP, partial [Chloroflexota bacterium]|nr:three-Cys-motif partner protein TcmP [Chloroflexota bacterium]